MSLIHDVYAGSNYRKLIDSLDELLYRKTSNEAPKNIVDFLLLQVYKPISDLENKFCSMCRRYINKN